MAKREVITIEPCPIEEAVLEIRFSSGFPSEAIFGMIYSAVREYFQGARPVALPITQLPEQIRDLDPNLKYQAHHQLEKNNFRLGIGPRVIVFSNTIRYAGWNAWSDFIKKTSLMINASGIIENIERLGLRYVNVFDGPILEKINFQLHYGEKKLIEETTNLRTELIDNDILKVLQISNSVYVNIGESKKTCSIIDIDCILSINMLESEFFEQFDSIVNKLHSEEKQLFFKLLKTSFIEKLNPIYEV
jgi:uncharacterized protein (TIGR04255 family)